MKRLGMAVVVLIVVVGGAYSGSGVDAQDGAAPTISALQTVVADLRGTVIARGEKINEQRTQIADLDAGEDDRIAKTPTVGPIKAADAEWIEAAPGINYYFYTAEDGLGSVYAFAEVWNTTASVIGAPALSITLTDAEANIVASSGLAAIFPNVDPGTTTPYQIYLDSVIPDSWVNEELEVAFYDIGPFTCTMEVRDLEEVEKSDTRLVLEGNVFNGGTSTADGIIVFAALYRVDGLFAGIITDGSDQGAVPPGKKSRFRISGSIPPGFSAAEPPGNYTYRLLIGMSLADARC